MLYKLNWKVLKMGIDWTPLWRCVNVGASSKRKRGFTVMVNKAKIQQVEGLHWKMAVFSTKLAPNQAHDFTAKSFFLSLWQLTAAISSTLAENEVHPLLWSSLLPQMHSLHKWALKPLILLRSEANMKSQSMAMKHNSRSGWSTLRIG